MATDNRKANRKAEKEKARRMEKIELLLWKLGIGAVVVAFFVIVGVTCVNIFKDYQATKPNYDSTDLAVSDLVGVLQATEAAQEDDGDLVIEPAVDTAEGEAASVEEVESAEAEEVESAEAVEGESEAAGESEEAAEGESAAEADAKEADASEAAENGGSEAGEAESAAEG